MTDQIKSESYGSAAKILHWTIVLLVAVQFGVAWTMPEIHRNTQPETLINLHLSLGATIILIMLVRLGWRLLHPVALSKAGVPSWQVLAASVAHRLLYALLIVMPVLGWANANSRGWDVTIFGFVPLPAIMAAHTPVGHSFGDVHTLLAYCLLGLVGVHAAGAFYHHFRLGDGTLGRMLPK